MSRILKSPGSHLNPPKTSVRELVRNLVCTAMSSNASSSSRTDKKVALALPKRPSDESRRVSQFQDEHEHLPPVWRHVARIQHHCAVAAATRSQKCFGWATPWIWAVVGSLQRVSYELVCIFLLQGSLFPYSKCLRTIFCSVWFLATIAFVHCWSTTYPRVNLALRASLRLKYVPIRILWRPTPNHEPSIPIQASLSERMNSSSSSSSRDTSTCSRLFTHCTTPSWRFCT